MFWSTIIPTRNPRPEFFRRAFGSAHAQLVRGDGEILVQDNGDLWDTIDCLPGIITSYAKNPTDLGCYGSVNAALKRAKGEFVHVCHDDDWVLPGFYERMRTIASQLPAKAGLLACRCLIVDEGKGPRGSNLTKIPTDGLTRLLPGALDRDNPFQVCQVVIRRSVFESVGLFREDLQYVADWEFYRRAAQEWDVWCLPETLCAYRVHEGQLTRALESSGRAKRERELMAV